ncbi:unnamed protein product [Ixodes hexagonus]
MDNELLITVVEARPSLWQLRHKGHSNRNKKRALWSQVGAIMLLGVTDGAIHVQRRWKSLRDKFRRLLTARKHAHKNGAGPEDVEGAGDVGWPFFEQLLFLKDTTEGRPELGGLNIVSNQAQGLLLGMSQYGDIDNVPVLFVEDAHDSTSPDGSPSSPDGASTSAASASSAPGVLDPEGAAPRGMAIRSQPPAPRQQKRRRSDDVLQQQLDEVSSRLAACKERDEDECFALSLVSHVRAVSAIKKLQMRARISELLDVFKDY